MPNQNRRNTLARRRTELSSRERNKTRKSNKKSSTVNRRNRMIAAMVAARNAFNRSRRNKTKKVTQH